MGGLCIHKRIFFYFVFYRRVERWERNTKMWGFASPRKSENPAFPSQMQQTPCCRVTILTLNHSQAGLWSESSNTYLAGLRGTEVTWQLCTGVLRRDTFPYRGDNNTISDVRKDCMEAFILCCVLELLMGEKTQTHTGLPKRRITKHQWAVWQSFFTCDTIKCLFYSFFFFLPSLFWTPSSLSNILLFHYIIC